ncbi:hypothetical protein FJT64_006690 [Amphibalanus amphitrite]|uniref:Uncharacterized protein n=1 Tax=Amphibalanus amphitrite TaxID=1232801 RepID=A0A6A4VWL9_AMPAM|nr:hypothetical protein FJT64_006690 [Amphibalanus amphitrite]
MYGRLVRRSRDMLLSALLLGLLGVLLATEPTGPATAAGGHQQATAEFAQTVTLVVSDLPRASRAEVTGGAAALQAGAFGTAVDPQEPQSRIIPVFSSFGDVLRGGAGRPRPVPSAPTLIGSTPPPAPAAASAVSSLQPSLTSQPQSPAATATPGVLSVLPPNLLAALDGCCAVQAAVQAAVQTAIQATLQSLHRPESTLYVTESRLTLSPTTVRHTVTRHRLGTLYRAMEVCSVTAHSVRAHTLLQSRYRTVTEHLSVTDTVHNSVTETVTLARPTTVTVLRTVQRAAPATAVTSYTTVTRRTTLTRTEASTSTARATSTAVATARRTERVTVTVDVTSTAPAATTTRTLIYCPEGLGGGDRY